MRRALALALVAVLALVLGVAGAAAKLTPAEQKWVDPVVKVYNVETANLGAVQTEMRASGALIPDSGKANSELTLTLANFVQCAASVKAAGAAPSLRLEAFRTDMLSSCSHLSTGAQDIARAIGQVAKGNGPGARSLIDKALPELAKGSQLLDAAAKQLLVVAGKSLFAA